MRRLLAVAVFGLMAAASTPRPVVMLLTDLPLTQGEGSIADVLAGRSTRSPILAALDKDFDIRPLSIVSPATLTSKLLIIAQPRLLAPSELVALDSWVRGGGHLLLFTDPQLVWPSIYPLGDHRRAPPIGLLDPLLAHWGVVLGDSDGVTRTRSIDGYSLATAGAGTWRAGPGCKTPDPLIADCQIGSGRALLVADADILDARLSRRTPDWLQFRLAQLSGRPASIPSRWGPLAELIVGILVLILLYLTFIKNRQRTNSANKV